MNDEEDTIDENEEEDTGSEVKNPLELSDEEILNMSPEDFEEPAASKDEEDPSDDEDDTDEEEFDEQETETEEAASGTKDAFSEDTKPTDTEEVEDEKTTDSEPEPKEDTSEETEDSKQSLEKSEKIDYKVEYEKLIAPFKAAGKDIQVQSVDEAIRLMQMGVGFNKKTASFKEYKRKVQPLEDHNLLTEENISLFIDLVAKKDQNALKKLIGDFGLDPMDIEIDDSSEYKPNTYTVDESQLELDDVLDSLRDSTHYTNILEIIGNKWDEPSKQAVAARPSIMQDLDNHMTNGTYHKVSVEVDRLRMLGQLPAGMSDLEAYNNVGSYMAKNNLLQEAEKPPLNQDSEPTTAATIPAKPTNPELDSRRKAAATTKSMPSGKKTKQTVNPLNMSDEEFMKQGF